MHNATHETRQGYNNMLGKSKLSAELYNIKSRTFHSVRVINRIFI